MENPTKIALEIFVGEWCIFETDKTLLLGLVLNFVYLKGTKRQRQYSRDYAPVQFEPQKGVEARGIGVVGTWYVWDDIGIITKIENFKKDFVSIESYRATVRRSPHFDCGRLGGRLIFYEDQFEEIQKIKIGK